MMRILLITLALVVASCGVQRPLIKPSAIPAFKEQQREKREKMEQEQRELEQSVQEQQAQ